MTDQMSVERYLAEGGVLTSPDNVPPRYRADLLRLMATFVDSEMAGAAGFADVINQGPGIKERIAAAKIVLEKNDHADKVLGLMAEFGANSEKYDKYHAWTKRLDRDENIGASRHGSDMRLSTFQYPIDGWIDAVVMNVLMGTAVNLQLAEFSRVSYQPLAEIFRDIQPVEKRHTELGVEGLQKILADAKNKAAVQASVDYWWPRVADSFGAADLKRLNAQLAFGLRHESNADLLAKWRKIATKLVKDAGLNSA